MNEWNYKIFWDEVINQFKEELPHFAFSMFFPVTEYEKSTENGIIIAVPSNFVKIQMIQKYKHDIERKLLEISGRNLAIDFNVKEQIITDSGNTDETDEPVLHSAHTKTHTDLKEKELRKSHPDLNGDYNFDDFIIGPNNNFAVNAAIAITKNPGTAYNPFLIYGGVGLGKTHLMEAIGNEILEKTNLKVLYVPTEDFMNEFIKCLSENKMQVFKSKYRYVDILLLDDIQFFEKKEQLQNEFFYTFNHLYDTKKQMVFTCDRPPNTLQNLTDRLKSRFEQGLTVDLKPPSFETRCAILRKKMEVNNKKLPQDIIELVARNISSNVRDLNAAFLKLTAYQDMTNKELNIEKAAELLQDSFSDKRQKNFSLDKILKVTANHFEISVSDIRGKSRNKTIALARHIVMFLAHEMTQMSSSEIGSEVGNRTHGTVLHSCDVISNAILSDTSIQTILEQLKNNLQNLPD